MKVYTKESIVNGIRANLDTSIFAFTQAIMELPEGDNKEELKLITFSDIFNINSIKNPDDCLKEMIKHPIKLLGVSEIEKLLQCNRNILTKTLTLLEMKGGMNGWSVETDGLRRGKKYTLVKND
jgi:hypothetical protein